MSKALVAHGGFSFRVGPVRRNVIASRAALPSAKTGRRFFNPRAPINKRSLRRLPGQPYRNYQTIPEILDHRPSPAPTMAPTTRSQTSSTPSKSIVTPPSTTSRKPVLAILGTGWAGFTLLQELSSSALLQTHDVIVLSPARTMALTPLLASAACGIFDFRVAEEPVRRIGMMAPARAESRSGGEIQKYQVWVEKVDFDARILTCRPAVGSNGNEQASEGDSPATFEVPFDQLVMAPGSEVNTFGTPGVEQHCLFMKSVSDAMALRERVLDCFELASLPSFAEERKREMLHFVIVGGGPTGVELAAELDELVHGHLLHIYPACRGLVRISVYDVADRILGQFGEKLSEYAMEKFRRRDVNVRMSRHIQGFKKGVMSVKEEGDVGFGVAVWAAGNKTCALVEAMEGVRKEAKGQLVTDQQLRVLREGGGDGGRDGVGDGVGVGHGHRHARAALDGVYAIGDAATIDGQPLPPTAEVAVQQAKWLARHLLALDCAQAAQHRVSSSAGELDSGFRYQATAAVAYLGRQDGVVEGGGQWTGKSAWLAWRGGSLQWSRSWRRKAVMVVYWLLNKCDGRELARR